MRKQNSSRAPLTPLVFIFPTMEVNSAPKQPGYKLSSNIFLCVGRRKNSYRFGTTWGWVNDERIFIFGWTVPLILIVSVLVFIFSREDNVFWDSLLFRQFLNSTLSIMLCKSIYSLCIFHLPNQGYRSLTTNNPFQSLSLLIQLPTPASPFSSPSDHDNPLHPSNMSSPIRLVSAFEKTTVSLSLSLQRFKREGICRSSTEEEPCLISPSGTHIQVGHVKAI